MNTTDFKRACDSMSDGNFSGDEALLSIANNGLFELKMLLNALWQCCLKQHVEIIKLERRMHNKDKLNNKLFEEVEKLRVAVGPSSCMMDQTEYHMRQLETLTDPCESCAHSSDTYSKACCECYELSCYRRKDNVER